VRCDLIADGIINAVKQVGVKIPVVVRLEGTNADVAPRAPESRVAWRSLRRSDLTDAATKVVRLARRRH